MGIVPFLIFGNLDQVAMKDIATLLISGKSYTYQLVSIYTEKRMEQSPSIENLRKNILTLITFLGKKNRPPDFVFKFLMNCWFLMDIPNGNPVFCK